MTSPGEPPIRVPKRDSRPSLGLRAAQLLIVVLVIIALAAKVFW
ncbi:MAG: hypothetical protein R2704_16685 [Microthrixaceae bacterium]